MSVLLINPPRTIQSGNIWKKIDRAFPPLGLAYIASYLEQQGEDVTVLDLQVENIDCNECGARIKSGGADFIGITGTTVEIDVALEIAVLCKDVLPDAKIVFGGVHSSIMPEEVLSNEYVDYVVRGEGEYTLHELVSGSSEPSSIPGLSYKDGDVIKHNEPRSFMDDLDAMPMPAYHLLPMADYKPSMGNYKRLPAATMIATRGCPGRCTFCYTGVSGKKARTKSAEKLLEEVKYLQKNYGIREVSFYDDTFTAFRSNVKRFCKALIQEKIDITWSCMSRLDCVDEEILGLMARAGCHQIGYGIESASPTILANIKKSISIDVVRENVALTKKAGIDVRAMFMLGNPGETEDTLRQTVDLALELKPDLAVFNITTPFPGTEMYDWAKKNGYLRDLTWSEYDLSRPVMDLPTISQDRIEYYYRNVYKRFYLRPSYLFKKMLGIRSWSEVKIGFRSLFSILSFQKELSNEE